MRPEVQIEAMKADDLTAVTSIEGPTQMSEANLREEMLRPWSRLWVAREDGVGVVAFVVAWHVVDELHVLNIATRSDRRRCGIGRSLMAALLEYGRLRGVRHLLLEVRRSNRPAIALYRGVGFFAMGVRRRYYADDEDAVEMVLTLDPETGDILRHTDEVRLDS
jgi:ribosomal-protein-alanine N-acetyltransferase